MGILGNDSVLWRQCNAVYLTPFLRTTTSNDNDLLKKVCSMVNCRSKSNPNVMSKTSNYDPNPPQWLVIQYFDLTMYAENNLNIVVNYERYNILVHVQAI